MIFLFVSDDGKLCFRFRKSGKNIPSFSLVEAYETYEEAGKRADNIVRETARFKAFCANKTPNFELGEDTWGTVPDNGFLKEGK